MKRPVHRRWRGALALVGV